MSLVVTVAIDITELITGQVVVRVNNSETLQLAINALDGDIAGAVIERLCDDVKGRGCDQVRQFVKQAGGAGGAP